MNLYSTRDDAIHYEIILALGEYADEHDIEAIADQVLTTTVGVTSYYYHLNEDVDFWAVVEDNAL